MARLLALVANTILLARAFAGKMTDLTTVVTLLALGAVAGQMTVSTARVAGLLASPRTTETASIGLGSTCGTLTGDMADLAALVALSSTGSAVSAATGTLIGIRGALPRKVTRLTTAVASLLLLGTSAFAAHVTIETAIVTDRGTTLRAFTSLMSALAAIVAGTSAVTAIRGSTTVGVHPE